MVFQQARLLLEYHFQYTGNDQVVMWTMLGDFAKFQPHEPYFYGQNYNFPLEVWLAVPLSWIGMPPYLSLPIVTAILFLLPYTFLAIWAHRKGNYTSALFSLSLPLLMPLEFTLIGGLSRGFVTGVFLSSFVLLLPESRNRLVPMSFGFLIAGGLILNPNAIVFSIPLIILILLRKNLDLRFIMLALGGAAVPLLAKFGADSFYLNRPELVVHSLWGNDFYWSNFTMAFTTLGRLFEYAMPVFWEFEWMVFFVLLALLVGLRKRQKKYEFAAILSALLMIVFALGIQKVHDGLDTVFLNTTRMWIGLPLLFGLGVQWLKEGQKTNLRHMILILIGAVIMFGLKQQKQSDSLKQITNKTDYGPVSIMSIEDLKLSCDEIKNMALERNVDLVAFVGNWDVSISSLDIMNHACTIIVEKFPRTIINDWERRTWRRMEETNNLNSRVLVIGWDDRWHEKFGAGMSEKIADSPRMYLLETEAQSIYTTFEELNIPYLDAQNTKHE